MVRVIATCYGARLLAFRNVHGSVKTCQLDAVPERSPYEPRGVRSIIDNEIRVYGIPVVAGHRAVGILLPVVRRYDAALILPHIRTQGAAAEQAYGRAVLTKGRAAVSHPPLPVPLDNIRRPNMTFEARHAVCCPTRDDGHNRLWQHSPCLEVFGCHLLYAPAGGIKVISVSILGHNGVMSHWRLGSKCFAWKSTTLSLCHTRKRCHYE